MRVGFLICDCPPSWTTAPKRRVETVERLVDFGFGDDERRQQPHDGLGRAVDDDAALERGRHDRRRVACQLEAPHQAGAADLLTIGVPGGDRPEPLLEMPADAADVRDQAAADQLVEEAQRRAAGQQIAAVRAAVIAERDRVRDLLADERGADRHAAAERLAERHQVRLEADDRRSRTGSRCARARSALRRR